MKKILILAIVGVTLFLGTVIGLLAAQGRLNHAGTRGIPVLSSFFASPPPGSAADGKGDDHHGPGGAASVPAAPQVEPAPAAGARPTDAPAQRSQGLGREEPMPYRQAAPLFKGPAPTGGGAQDGPAAGRGEPVAKEHTGDGAPANSDHGAVIAADQEAGHGKAATAAQPEVSSEWKAKVESVLGQGQYRPGRLWSFPQIETGIGVDELNQILLRARQQQVDLDRDRAAVQKQQAELEARERDVTDRQDAVLEKLRDVEQLRAKLQAEIDEFHNTVLLIRQDEVSGLQSVAKTLAAVEPKSAAAVIKKWWETDEGQTRALKIWTVMEPDPANAILAELDVEMIRQVLEKRLKVAREQSKAKK